MILENYSRVVRHMRYTTVAFEGKYFVRRLEKSLTET